MSRSCRRFCHHYCCGLMLYKCNWFFSFLKKRGKTCWCSLKVERIGAATCRPSVCADVSLLDKKHKQQITEWSSISQQACVNVTNARCTLGLALMTQAAGWCFHMFNKHGRPRMAESQTVYPECWVQQPDGWETIPGPSPPPPPSPYNSQQPGLLHNSLLFFRAVWQSEPHAAWTFILLSQKCGLNEIIWATMLDWQGRDVPMCGLYKAEMRSGLWELGSFAQ